MEAARSARVERRLAAILAADVAGYSRLIGADEEGTLSRLKALRAEAIDPKLSGHHVRIVKTTGDGLLAEFASVIDALRCAVEVQQAIAERNTGVAADNRIELRIGINVGDMSSRTATSSVMASISPPASKAWPSLVGFAYRPASKRMRRRASTSPSKTWASRR